MSTPTPSMPIGASCNPVPGPDAQSAMNALEAVRLSFMKMGPRAFEVGHVMDEDLPSRFPTLSETEQIELWTKVWESFDFSDSQRIDVYQDWEEQPVDVQLLGLALSEWGELDVDDHHTIRDLVYERALDCGADLAKHAYDISRGLRRLKNYVRFKRACVLCMFGAMAAIDTTVRLQPQPPAEAASSGDSAGVPFPWLDVKLSHFQHLGWRLRPYPDVENEMIDYNDYADDQDPRARFIVHPRDHFTPWQEGGLLMTDVRVPLPQPLLQDTLSLGKALGLVYSTEYHPLCLLGEAWRFAKRLNRTPTDADLRAALLYQIMIVLHKEGPYQLWPLLDVDWAPK